jgi:hypothetical protein
MKYFFEIENWHKCFGCISIGKQCFHTSMYPTVSNSRLPQPQRARFPYSHPQWRGWSGFHPLQSLHLLCLIKTLPAYNTSTRIAQETLFHCCCSVYRTEKTIHLLFAGSCLVMNVILFVSQSLLSNGSMCFIVHFSSLLCFTCLVSLILLDSITLICR